MNMHARLNRGAAIWNMLKDGAAKVKDVFSYIYNNPKESAKHVGVVATTTLTFGGLAARSNYNAQNRLRYLRSLPDDQPEPSVDMQIAMAWALVTLINVVLTKTRPVKKLFYSDPPRENKPEDKKADDEFKGLGDDLYDVENPVPPASPTTSNRPYQRVRERSAKAFETLGKANCVGTALFTLAFTFLSWTKLVKSKDQYEELNWDDLFCLLATLSSIPTYYGSTLLPGFENVEKIAEFIKSGKCADIKFKKLAFILLLTSINLLGGFFFGSFAAENIAKHFILLKELLSTVSISADGTKIVTPSSMFCTISGVISFNSGLLMVLPSVYELDWNGDLPLKKNLNNLVLGGIKIPDVRSPCLRTVTCHQIENPYRLGTALVLFTWLIDNCIGGSLDSLTSTSRTISRLNPHADQNLVITLGALVALGGILMNFGFSMQTGVKRMLPPANENSPTLGESQSLIMLTEPLLVTQESAPQTGASLSTPRSKPIPVPPNAHRFKGWTDPKGSEEKTSTYIPAPQSRLYKKKLTQHSQKPERPWGEVSLGMSI